MVVIAKGPRLLQRLNHVVFAELVDEDAEYAALSGLLALQDHGIGFVTVIKGQSNKSTSIQTAKRR